MKLIIEIPYGLKDVYEHGNVTALDVEEMKRALRLGTPIPDNATNGDVMKAIFKPNRITRTDDDIVHIDYDFTPEWWNAPYQKGGKE